LIDEQQFWRSVLPDRLGIRNGEFWQKRPFAPPLLNGESWSVPAGSGVLGTNVSYALLPAES